MSSRKGLRATARSAAHTEPSAVRHHAIHRAVGLLPRLSSASFAQIPHAAILHGGPFRPAMSSDHHSDHHSSHHQSSHHHIGKLIVDTIANHPKLDVILFAFALAVALMLASFGYCCFQSRKRKKLRAATRRVATMSFDLEGGSPAAGAPLPPGILDACAKGDVFAIKAWIADEARAILAQFWRTSAQSSEAPSITSTALRDRRRVQRGLADRFARRREGRPRPRDPAARRGGRRRASGRQRPAGVRRGPALPPAPPPLPLSSPPPPALSCRRRSTSSPPPATACASRRCSTPGATRAPRTWRARRARKYSAQFSAQFTVCNSAQFSRFDRLTSLLARADGARLGRGGAAHGRAADDAARARATRGERQQRRGAPTRQIAARAHVWLL